MPTSTICGLGMIKFHFAMTKITISFTMRCIWGIYLLLTFNVQNAEGIVATQLMYADAVWDRVTVEDDELSFKVGDVIEILDMTDDKWWHGSVGESTGWFPANFVRVG